MKRFLALFLTIIMLLAMFAACKPDNGTQNTGTTPEGTTPAVTTPEVTTPEQTTPEQTTPEQTTPEQTTSTGDIPNFDEPAAPTAKMAGEIVAALNPKETFWQPLTVKKQFLRT